MQKNKWFPAVLQLFADGGAAGGDAGGTAADAGQQQGDAGDVIYGKPETGAQDPAAHQTNETETKTDFETLIKGEYKDDFGRKVEDIVQKRLKNAKETVERYNALSPMLDMLGRKYGVDPKDAAALAKAIEDDDAYYEEEAMERGMSVADLKTIRRLERENEALKAQEQDREAQIQAEQDVKIWIGQAEEAKKVYPNLDLGEELKNERFVGLLKSGIDVETAYMAVHARDVVPAAVQQAAEQGKAMAAAAVAAGQSRPRENGAGIADGKPYNRDVSKMSADEFEALREQVRSGARIVL